MLYRFADCVLDTERYALRRAGEGIALERKVFEVLRYVLEHRDRLVSRTELLEHCWPEAFVSDETLTRCISRVRQAIGQSSTSPPLLQTIRGLGYRFTGTVTEVAPAPPAALETPQGARESGGPTVLPESDVGQHRTGAVSPPEPSTPEPPAWPPQAPGPSAAAVPSATGAERRQLTVLSCAFADAEALLAHLDLEDYHRLLQSGRTACRAIIEQFEGSVAQQFDEGVLAYFGYPLAHEDDAHRALRAGLQLVETLGHQVPARHHNSESDLHQTGLAMRVGIHTGVVIAEPGSATRAAPSLAVGLTPRLAVAVRQLARPQTVVVSAATAQLVEGYFVLKDLGVHQLAGQPQAVAVYEVRQASRLQTRLEVAAVRGLTPFVGREAEVALLHERWAHVQEGLGQAIIVRGEAGIGKSRLLQELKDQVGEASHLRLECRCSPYHQNTALYALADLVQRALPVPQAAFPEARIEALETLLRHANVPLDATVPLLADLVGLSLPPERYAPLTMPPQRQRQRTMEALLDLLLAQATAQPVLWIVEDVHWADPSTLEFLELVMRQVATVPMLVVLTCRPTFALPWQVGTPVTLMVLERLTQRQVEQMITQVAGGKRLPAEVLQQLVDKTDGVPLYVEELTRLVVESGQLRELDDRYDLTGERTHLVIPSTLQDSLMARLDRLGVGKEVAQWGAVLGREFPYETLEAVTPFEPATLQASLQQLVEAEVLLQRRLGPQARYRFKHALLQDAAYNALLQRQQQEMHLQIAQRLLAHFPDMGETQPEVLAQHFTAAGHHERAIEYWHRAGQRSYERSAYVEAVNYLTQGLTLLLTRPEGCEPSAWLHQELMLRIALGKALVATRGFAAPEVEHAYMRARDLCEQLGNTTQLFAVLHGLWRLYVGRGALRQTDALEEQVLSLAQQAQTPPLLLAAYSVQGMSRLYRGDVLTARVTLQHCVPLYHAHQPALEVSLYGGADAGVSALACLAIVLWLLGYPSQAAAKSQQALTLAQDLAHPFSLAFALGFATVLSMCLSQPRVTQTQAERLMAVATAHHFPYWLALGRLQQGGALVAQGEVAQGLTQIQQGWAAVEESWLEYHYIVIAEAYWRAGLVDAGLAVLHDALVLMDTHGTGCWESTAYRLQGDLLLQQEASQVPQAVTCWQQALTVARRQQARSLELQAALRLARLWGQQGQRDEARNVLAPVYGWFTEGFDTADLQAATALLDGLS